MYAAGKYYILYHAASRSAFYFVILKKHNTMGEIKIPKTIHYCWLSGEEMPADIVKCMDSWKARMPEYKLVLWDTNKFDVGSHAFVREACQVKKWAFASDYIRLYALYTEGGIYLDTDVYVEKSFDCFLENGFFSAVEYLEGKARKGLHLLNGDGTLKDRNAGVFTHGIQIQAAIMGAVKGHPFLKSCMERYDGKHFILEDGSYSNRLLSPQIYADVAVDYGFRYKNELQRLKNDMTVYPNAMFPCALPHIVDGYYAVHLCKGEWRDPGLKERILSVLHQNGFLRWLFGKKKIKKVF